MDKKTENRYKKIKRDCLQIFIMETASFFNMYRTNPIYNSLPILCTISAKQRKLFSSVLYQTPALCD